MELKPVYICGIRIHHGLSGNTKKESIQRIWDFSNVFMNMDIWALKTGDSDSEVTPEEKNKQFKFAAARELKGMLE